MCEWSTSDNATVTTLPGQSSVLLKNSTHLRHFLEKEFCSADLETIALRLWIITTLSSASINPLHRQRVEVREIIVTEEPRLHLVWIYNRIFIKPLPQYLLSQAFWEMYLDTSYMAYTLCVRPSIYNPEFYVGCASGRAVGSCSLGIGLVCVSLI